MNELAQTIIASACGIAIVLVALAIVVSAARGKSTEKENTP